MAEKNILTYAAGGAGKSTLFAQIMGAVFKETGKKSRVVTADGGGIEAYKPLIEDGVCEALNLEMWETESLFGLLDRLTKGDWPENPKEVGGRLLPCKRLWRECPNCKGEAGTVGVALCTACKKPIPAGTRLPLKFTLVNGAENIGVIAFEGLTAFGNRLMDRLRTVDPEGGRSIKDGDFTIAASGQQHYGDAQNYSEHFVANTRGLPYDWVLWSAHELRGGDDGYGKPTYGPALPGKKLTALCIPWFTDVFHIDVEPLGRDASGVEQRAHKLYTAQHYPADTKPYGFVAKTSHTGLPPMIELKPKVNNGRVLLNAMAATRATSRELIYG